MPISVLQFVISIADKDPEIFCYKDNKLYSIILVSKIVELHIVTP